MNFSDLIKQISLGLPDTQPNLGEIEQVLAGLIKPAPVCQQLFAEACQETHRVLNLLDELEGGKHIANFDDLPVRKQIFIRSMVQQVFDSALPEIAKTVDRYRMGLILAAVRRAADAHDHSGHSYQSRDEG